MRSSHTLDRLETTFDDDRLVADAGLHLPAGWPWAGEFLAALARFRAIPLLA